MVEIELRGILSEVDFYKKLSSFTEIFGQPFRQRRLAIRIGKLNKYEINNRLKITNGIVEVVQKVGMFNSMVREEISFKISRDIDEIYNAYLIMRNTIIDVSLRKSVIMQFDNFIFNEKDFEVKLAHQTGKSDKFVFEIEAKKEGTDLFEICRKLNIDPNMHELSDVEWEKWNNELNLDVDELDEDYIKRLIKIYLNYNMHR